MVCSYLNTNLLMVCEFCLFYVYFHSIRIQKITEMQYLPERSPWQMISLDITKFKRSVVGPGSVKISSINSEMTKNLCI